MEWVTGSGGWEFVCGHIPAWPKADNISGYERGESGWNNLEQEISNKICIMYTAIVSYKGRVQYKIKIIIVIYTKM